MLEQNWPGLRNYPNLKSFKLGILVHVRPPPKKIFDIHDPTVMKWLFQLRVGLSPLQAHKNNHNFSDTPCDKCDVCKRTENIEHFFLHCIHFTGTRRTLLNSVLTLNVNFNQLNPQNKIQLLLYGDTSFSDAINKLSPPPHPKKNFMFSVNCMGVVSAQNQE